MMVAEQNPNMWLGARAPSMQTDLNAKDRLPARFLSMSEVSFVSLLMMRPVGVVW
jgi:hypothetical protein